MRSDFVDLVGCDVGGGIGKSRWDGALRRVRVGGCVGWLGGGEVEGWGVWVDRETVGRYDN